MFLLTKLIPFRDWIYAAIAVAGVVFWFHHDHVEQARGAARVNTAVMAATQRAAAVAHAKIVQLNTQHATEVAKVENTYENALVAASSQHAADLRRLHDYEIYREAHGVLGGSSSPSAKAPQGAGSVERLEQVSAELADALRQDDAALNECYADRDSLTGK